VNRPYATPQIKQYQVIRKPRVAGSTTLELPADVSVDLSMSGTSISSNDFFAGYDPIDLYNQKISNNTYNANYQDTAPIDIVFDPSGHMRLVVSRGVVRQVNSSIYILVGKTENVVTGVGSRGGPPINSANTPGPELGLSQNLASNDSYWISVQYPTGAVATAENLGSSAPDLILARDLIRSGVAKGSR
jgi:hypothetical protein